MAVELLMRPCSTLLSDREPVDGVINAIRAGDESAERISQTLLLAVAPFAADTRFGAEVTLGGTTAYLPPCAGAFVGADITCRLAIGLYDQQETTLLMDIGTNGELMLWHNGKLYAASTAAGPAFEGGEISQGCGGIAGAIDKVWVEGNGLGVRVIGGGTPVGVCGSGLIDAIAALLHLGRIDPSAQPMRHGYPWPTASA